MGVGDDKALLRSFLADRREPRIRESSRWLVSLELKARDREQAVDVSGAGLCSRTAQAGKRQSQGGRPGLHCNAWVGQTILRPFARAAQLERPVQPPRPKPSRWVARRARLGATPVLYPCWTIVPVAGYIFISTSAVDGQALEATATG